MPANIPSTSNGGSCFTRNSPSRCMVDITTSHKKLVNSPNGYLLQPFKKLTPIASHSSVSPSTKTTAPKEKSIEETTTQPYSDSSRPTTAAIKTSFTNAGKSVKISDNPPNIIGYDGGFDYYYSQNPSQGDGQEDALSLSPFANGHLSGGDCSKPERTEISSDDEEEIDYDDMNDNWEGGRNRSREERRKWALQTALNTERNAITKKLTTSPPLSSVVRSQGNAPAFRVRTWGESSSSSVGCTALTKSNGNTNDNSPCGLSGKFRGPSSMSSPPLLTTCKPISSVKISDFSPSIKSKDITIDKGPLSDNDTFMSDVLGHISDFLMAENVKNELGEKSLLEEIAESFKCVTLCNSDPTPKAQMPDPVERPLQNYEPPTSEISPLQPVNCCLQECRSTNLKSMENKSFLFSHAGGGLLGKLCTVATSIRESITSHPTLSTTIAPQSNSSPSLVNIKNDVVKEGPTSPQPHLYDLISSMDGSKLVLNTSSAPQTQPETVVVERESRKSSSVSVELPPPPKLDPSERSGHNESPQNVSNPSRSIISPVYEELDYGPPRTLPITTATQQRPANYNNTDTVVSELEATERLVCNDIPTPSTNLTSSLGSTNELVQGKGGKRNAVANFFQKSSTTVGTSHKPSFLGLGSGSRKGTREIRKEDIVVVLTSPLTDNSETHPNIPQTTTVPVKLSSPPITCNNSNSIIRFDSKLAAIAKDVNDYKGETEGDLVSDINKPEEARGLGTVLSNRLTHTLTEHSSLPTLSSNGVGRFDKSAFDSTKSNSLDTNRTQTKNAPALPVSLSKTTICSKTFPPPKQLAGPASQGVIKSFLHLNSSKKRNGGTLRSKSLDKSTAGTMPSNLSAVLANGDRRTTHKGASGVLMVVGDKKPLCTSSFVDLNSLVTNESSVPISSINTIRHNDNMTNNNSLDKNCQLLTPLANNSSGKFASLKNFFRKAPAPATINGHRDSHQRSSLACLTEQQAHKQQSNSPSSAGWVRPGPQRSQVVSSSYDDSGVSLTRTALEDDYATRKNPSYSSALDSFSSEESWSVSSNSAPDDRSNLRQASSTMVLNELAAIGHVKSKVRPDLQSKPLPPIPVNRELGSSLTFPTILNTTNTSSSSELEFSGEGIITARAQLMKSNSSPLQKPLGKPRVPPPKPPVTQNLDRAIPRLVKNITNSKEDKQPTLDLIIEPPNQIAKSSKGPQVLKKPEVPARPPKLSPKTAQPLSKCGTASIGKKSGQTISTIINKETNLPAKPLTPSKSDVSDMPRRKPPPPPPIIMMRQENKIDPNEYYDPLANSTTSSLTQVTTQPSNTHTGAVNEKSNDLDAACKSSNGPNPFYEEYLTPVCSSVTVSANVELKEVPTSHITNTAPDILGKKMSQRFSENFAVNDKSGKKGTLKTPCKMDEDQRSLIIAGLRPSEIKKTQQKH